MTTNPNPTNRMHFIPELCELIVNQLARQGIQASLVGMALKKWDAGELASTPIELGCFKVFAEVQEQVESAG